MHADLSLLLQRYLRGETGEAEAAMLARLIADPANEATVKAVLEEHFDDMPVDFRLAEPASEAIIKAILSEAPAQGIYRRMSFFRRWGWAAAAVLLLVMAGFYFLWQPGKHPPEVVTQNVPVQDIAPGRNGATLTLADGRLVVLDSLGNGVIASQQGTKVVLQNGQLSYTPAAANNEQMSYNTMTTPNGRQFRLTLPDGTEVWLNAASSIRYPTAFTGYERKVEVTGEAYFEVAKNAHMPFRVRVNDRADIEVLGTHFNVNAYENESSIHTTLLEGSVSIKTAKQETIIKPGQQAQLTESMKVVDEVDVDKVMAWKNGLFNFDGMDLPYAMRQIARWYNVEVVYQGKAPDITFYGSISRNISLSSLIKGLKSSAGVDMEIKDGKLIVIQ